MSTHTFASREDVTYRKNDNEKEIDVGDIMELEVQVLGYKTDGRIFGGSDLVADELLFSVPLFVLLFRRQGNVHIDISWLRAIIFLLDAHRTVVCNMPMFLSIIVPFLLVCR